MKERGWINVVVADPGANVDRPARSTHRLTSADTLPGSYLHRGKKRQRDSNPVFAGDDDEPTIPNGAGETHDPVSGRKHVCAVGRGDVDAAVPGAVRPRGWPPRIGDDASNRGRAQNRDGWIGRRWRQR